MIERTLWCVKIVELSVMLNLYDTVMTRPYNTIYRRNVVPCIDSGLLGVEVHNRAQFYKYVIV